jgi:hypothetical protein
MKDDINEPGRREAIVIDSSPIPFAIVGPLGRHRAILVRSSLPCLDLVGLSPDRKNVGENTMITRLFGPTANSAIIESSAAISADFFSGLADGEESTDYRRSKLTFSWRGLANQQGVEKLSRMFSEITPDLIAVLRKGKLSDIEWQIAPLIAACTDLNIRESGRLRRLRIIFYTIVLIYLALISFVAATYISRGV